MACSQNSTPRDNADPVPAQLKKLPAISDQRPSLSYVKKLPTFEAIQNLTACVSLISRKKRQFRERKQSSQHQIQEKSANYCTETRTHVRDQNNPYGFGKNIRPMGRVCAGRDENTGHGSSGSIDRHYSSLREHLNEGLLREIHRANLTQLMDAWTEVNRSDAPALQVVERRLWDELISRVVVA